MDADDKKTIIAIEIDHPQEEQRLHYYKQFLSLKKLLESTTGYTWQWNETLHTEHKTISSISQQLDNIKVLNQANWPAIISFLKPRIIALDIFWDLVKDGFE